MCGIAGAFSKIKKDFSKDVELMTHELSHRGPDSEGFGFYSDEGVFFGQRRLRIIDLDPRSDQPMYSPDKEAMIIFNGEIYNYLNIKKDLEERGYKFNSSSDTEVIILGYVEYGTDIFSKLDGDFALAIWDFKRKKLVLARDRMGLKPLYLIKLDGDYFFSSEAKAFRKSGHLKPHLSVNFDIFHTLVGFQYNFDKRKTLITNVEKVEPSTFIEITEDCYEEKKYWTLPQKEIKISYEDAVEKTYNLLYSAVEKRVLNCDVPQAILLSGGLDSSSVAVLANKVSMGKKIKTFTAISDNKLDERSYASIVANDIGADHNEIQMDGAGILEDIEEIIKTYDDLNTVDPGVVSVNLLSKKIYDTGIRVVLVGEGADEVFGGYSWFGLSKFPFNILSNYVRSQLYYYILSRCISFNQFNFHRKLFREILNEYKNDDIFKQISNFEIDRQLPNHFNMKVDKGNMSHSLEARAPFLDYKLIEFVYNLPSEYKLNGRYFNHWQSWEKRVLRDAMKDDLPANITARKKHGFMLSMIDTMNANLDMVVERVKKNKDIIVEGLRSEEYFDRLIKGHELHHKEREFMLWKLFLFSVWYDYYFDS